MTFLDITTKPARATCWCVVDCGLQTWFFEDRPRRVRELRLGFELIDERGRNGDRITIEQRYHRSYWPTANLKRDVETMIGRPMTLAERGLPETAGGFNLGSLLHRTVTLELLTKGRYRAITGMKPVIGPPYPANRPVLHFSLERFDVDAFHRLPDRLRDRVVASPTFHALHMDALDEAALWPVEHRREPTSSELLGGDEVPW